MQGQLTRNNLKIINQPLDAEQQKLLLNYIEGCLQEIFSLLADFKLEIMDAYRLRAIGNPTQRPAPIIVKFLTSSTRGQLLKLSRQPTKLKYHGWKIVIYPDLFLQCSNYSKTYIWCLCLQELREISASINLLSFLRMRSKWSKQVHRLLWKFYMLWMMNNSFVSLSSPSFTMWIGIAHSSPLGQKIHLQTMCYMHLLEISEWSLI